VRVIVNVERLFEKTTHERRFSMKDEPTRVLETLEMSSYDWMTIQSIAQDTGLPEKEVKLILESLVLGSQVIKKPDIDGSPIYATRAHYMRGTNLLNRTLSVLADRVK
jgi:hypothetical protein